MDIIKIAMFSYADINNYGDILFSHVFKHEIEKRIANVDIDFYTPSEIELEDFSYKSYHRDKVKGKYDALILAGGEVVHLFEERTWKPIYEKNNQKVLSENAYDVVWDWIDDDSSFKAWISVGVRPFGDKWDDDKINKSITDLDYISVRGILSKKILEHGDYEEFNDKIKITPDLGWIFPEYLNVRNEAGQHYKKWSFDSKYIIFQVHNITDIEAKNISNALLQFKKETGFEVLLMPVIHLWKDEKYLELILEASGGEFKLLPNNLTVLEMLDLIVHSEIVLCSSLHVAITALAKGIPAAIFNKWQGTKLQDLYGLQFRSEYLFSDSLDTYNVLCRLFIEKQNSKSLHLYADFMKAKLNETFDEISEKITKSKS